MHTGVAPAGTVVKADRGRIHLAVLLVAGWVIGLVIALVLGLLEPAMSVPAAGQHARDAELAGRRWSAPALQSGTAPVLQLAGRRWSAPALQSGTAPVLQLAGRRWSAPALQSGTAPVLQLAGRRWSTPVRPTARTLMVAFDLATAPPALSLC